MDFMIVDCFTCSRVDNAFCRPEEPRGDRDKSTQQGAFAAPSSGEFQPFINTNEVRMDFDDMVIKMGDSKVGRCRCLDGFYPVFAVRRSCFSFSKITQKYRGSTQGLTDRNLQRWT